MIFFTTLGLVISLLILYSFFFIIIVLIAGGFNEENIIMATIIIALVSSFILADFITEPEDFGYQKITVSENIMEVKE